MCTRPTIQDDCESGFGLFGSTPVLTYSKFIHAIVPDGGPAPGGMARIAPAQVLERIAPYLSRQKVQA
jgi:hypothetical protein